MSIDIILWIESIRQIGTDLSKVLEIVKAMRCTNFTKKDKVNEATKDIEDISEKIGYLRKIGEILDEYIDYYTETRILYMETDKFIELINRYQTDLSDKNTIFYNVHWETIENAFKDITKIKSEYINIILDRIIYFDYKDATQIRIFISDFNSTYDKSQAYIRIKDVDNLKRQVEELSDKSLTIHNIFKNSIKKIIDGLKGT